MEYTLEQIENSLKSEVEKLKTQLHECSDIHHRAALNYKCANWEKMEYADKSKVQTIMANTTLIDAAIAVLNKINTQL